jgi:hypothetical protein
MNDGRGPAKDIDLPLETLGDVQREIAKVYRAAKLGSIYPKIGAELTRILETLARVMADRRDNKYKIQLNKLWSEYQARLNAPRSTPGTLISSSVVDVTVDTTLHGNTSNNSINSDSTGDNTIVASDSPGKE